MASSDEAPAQGTQRPSDVGLATGEAGADTRRRGRSKEVAEVVDELAQETKRVTLLEREEQQLKGQKHVSRVLFVLGIVDERKTQDAVEQEFTAWRGQTEGAKDVTGVLLFCGQSAVSFLEGPTELLFKAVELFNGLTVEVQASAVMPTPPDDMKVGDPKVAIVPPAAPRPALISALRVLYFTELHGVRTAGDWCAVVSNAKPGGAQQLEDMSQQVFELYKKILVLCLKATENVGTAEGADAWTSAYRKEVELMPAADEVIMLLSKQNSDNFFSFPEFQKIFMKPFQLVLNSELLWPMPPPLSY